MCHSFVRDVMSSFALVYGVMFWSLGGSTLVFLTGVVGSGTRAATMLRQLESTLLVILDLVSYVPPLSGTCSHSMNCA